MKKNLKTTCFLVLVIVTIFMNGCSSDDNITAQKQIPSNVLSDDQLASIQAQADKIAKETVAQINSGANKRSPGGYDFVDLNVTTVTGTGPTSALYGFNAGVRNSALLNPSMIVNYNYLFCAGASHFRYAIIYFYNGYTHTATSMGAVYGPTGGCLTGSTSFSVNMGGANTSQAFAVVFDVLNGPGGGATQVPGAGTIWSNQRDLTYPNTHILNPGYYWY